MSSRNQSSANRKTLIRFLDPVTNTEKTIISEINYKSDFKALLKNLECSMRLSPSDPVYMVDKVFLKSNGAFTDIAGNISEDMQKIIFASDQVSLQVPLFILILAHLIYNLFPPVGR